MALYLTNAPVTGASVSPDQITIRAVLLTAAAANATAVIYSAGNPVMKLAALAGTSFEFGSITGGNQWSAEHLVGPVTIDVAGAGAHLRLSY